MRLKKFLNKNKAALLLIVASGIGVGLFNASKAVQPDYQTAKSIKVSGRIEGFETKVGVTVPARVISVGLQEGESAKKNQLLIQLDDADLGPKLRQADAALNAAKQQEALARSWLSSVRSQIAAADQLQSPNRTVLRTTSNAVSMPNAEEQLAEQQRVLEEKGREALVRLDKEQSEQLSALQQATKTRLNELEESFNASLQKLQANYPGRDLSGNGGNGQAGDQQDLLMAKKESLESNHQTEKNAIEQTAQVKLKALQESYLIKKQALSQTIAARKEALKQVAAALARMQHALANNNASSSRDQVMNVARAAQNRAQVIEAESKLLNASAAVMQSEAARDEIMARRAAYSISSQCDGTCISRSVEPGEVVMPGQVLMRISSKDRAFMKAAVPDTIAPRIRAGQPARVLIDGHPTALPATVISLEPADVYSPGEKQAAKIFAVKLKLINNDVKIKPGTPAKAEIILQS